MSIFYINNGKKEKARHHIDVQTFAYRTFSIPQEMTGCQVQCFKSSSLRKVMRFYLKHTEIDVDNGKVRNWYAGSAKEFFKLSMRLSQPYIRNLEVISAIMGNACLDHAGCRGTRLDDIPGNITAKSVIGMETYNKKPSRLTYELADLIGEKGEEKQKKIKSFDYWVFDPEMLKRGLALTVGNEDDIEFIRYHVLASSEEAIMTAYVRPWFCEEYDM